MQILVLRFFNKGNAAQDGKMQGKGRKDGERRRKEKGERKGGKAKK
jgi:hypothetical protein